MNNNINDVNNDGDDNSIIAVERDFTFLSLNPVARKKGWCFVRCLEKKLYEKSNKKRKQKSLFLLFFVQHRHCGGDCQKTGNANKRVWLESLIEEVLFSTQMLLPPFPPTSSFRLSIVVVVAIGVDAVGIIVVAGCVGITAVGCVVWVAVDGCDGIHAVGCVVALGSAYAGFVAALGSAHAGCVAALGSAYSGCCCCCTCCFLCYCCSWYYYLLFVFW